MGTFSLDEGRLLFSRWSNCDLTFYRVRLGSGPVRPFDWSTLKLNRVFIVFLIFLLIHRVIQSDWSCYRVSTRCVRLDGRRPTRTTATNNYNKSGNKNNTRSSRPRDEKSNNKKKWLKQRRKKNKITTTTTTTTTASTTTTTTTTKWPHAEGGKKTKVKRRREKNELMKKYVRDCGIN